MWIFWWDTYFHIAIILRLSHNFTVRSLTRDMVLDNYSCIWQRLYSIKPTLNLSWVGKLSYLVMCTENHRHFHSLYGLMRSLGLFPFCTGIRNVLVFGLVGSIWRIFRPDHRQIGLEHGYRTSVWIR